MANRNLFIGSIEMKLTPHEVELVTRPINGDGGHQGLLRAIGLELQSTGELVLEDATLLAVYKYAYDYGGGGYQDRFRAIIAAATRAGWAPR